MKSTYTLRLIAGLIFFSLGIMPWSWGQNLPEIPNPPRLVNDFADVLTPVEENQLEQKLLAYEDSTGSQIAIVLIKSLEGFDVADYAIRLALKWKIGTQKDNGLLLLGAMDDRKFRIEVGYGLEPVITDGISKRIISESIKPNFKAGQYLQGLDEATTNLFKAARGEFQGEYKYSKNNKRKGKGLGIGIIIFIIFLIWLFSKMGGKGGSGGGGDFWMGMLLGNMLSGGRSRGGSSWGDFSSGSGSFGGFGGGSFGGGGASGDW